MTKNLILSALACLLIGVSATAEQPSLRVWRTSDGKQVGRAEAVDAKYDRKSRATLIYLKKPDGTMLTVPFQKLDKQGREFAWYGVQLRRAKQRSRPFTLLPPGTVKFTAALSSVDAENVPQTVIREGTSVQLGIDPRIHALGRPPEGWCGEVAIQEALLYYGIYYPQSQINAAGNPAHPDLYSNEIPRALSVLGMEFRQWPWRPTDLGDFLGWVREQIAIGAPVLTGVKIYPTKHEEWSLDHFVLAVGVEGDSLVLNTTWGFRYTLTERQLRSTQKGLAFANKYNTYYGISVMGSRRLEKGSRPVRLFVAKETADQMAVVVKCEDLEPGVEYSLYRLSSPKEENPAPQITFKAQQPVHALYDTITRRSPAIYRCQKVPREP